MVHDVRIDLKPDDYIDYMTYKLRPGAARQRGPAPWCCAAARPCALVLRGQRGTRPGVAPWQRRGRGGRAERLGPQLRSVRKQFLFLWYKTEHDVTAVIY